MTIWRGTGGGGNATTDSEVTLLTQLEQAATQAAADAAAAQAAALLAASEAAASAASIEGDVASAETARIAAQAAQEASEEARDASVVAQGLAEDARDAALAAEAALENVYTKDEADDLLDLKADQATTYTKTEVDSGLATKQAADAELTTLSGMGANRATFLASEQAFGSRNRIINGDMRIDQRNAGASVTGNNQVYSVDRWKTIAFQASKFSMQRNAGAVTPPAGYVNYLGITSLSAYTVGAAESFSVLQAVEGFNWADLGWGTASAQSVTLSFWVRSSLTGTFGGALWNSAASRSYPFSYSISAANTWEYKTLTIAGDTTGTWLSDNGVGVNVNFGLGSGATNSGTAGVWSGTLFNTATGATSVVGTNGATFYITGVQLEAGSVATPFERRPYGTELALCQRYYYSVGAAFYGNVSFHQFANGQVTSTTLASGIQPFPVTMRASPSFFATNPTNFRVGAAAGFFTVTAVALDIATPINANINYTSSGMTAGQACGIVQSAGNLAALNFSAEL